MGFAVLEVQSCSGPGRCTEGGRGQSEKKKSVIGMLFISTFCPSFSPLPNRLSPLISVTHTLLLTNTTSPSHLFDSTHSHWMKNKSDHGVVLIAFEDNNSTDNQSPLMVLSLWILFPKYCFILTKIIANVVESLYCIYMASRRQTQHTCQMSTLWITTSMLVD